MKRYLLATVSVLALAASAQAADLPVKAPPVAAPPPSLLWTGWYVGLQGGVASQRGTFQDTDDLFIGGFGANYVSSKVGGFFGANAGYNWQSGPWVYGLEGDINWVGAKAGSTITRGPIVFVTSFQVDWLATIRGRLGVTIDPATLIYLTGGAAFGGIKDTAIASFMPTTFPSVDKTKAGWVIGGGVEHMFAPHWTGRIEARYVDFGHSDATVCVNSATCYRGTFSNSLLMGLVALDYKF